MRHSIADLIRRETLAAIERGPHTAREIAEHILASNPGALNDYVQRNALALIQDRVSKIMKDLELKEQESLLPQLGDRLPAVICIDGDDEARAVYIKVMHSTVGQLRNGCDRLARQIAFDTKKWRGLVALYEQCKARGLGEGDFVSDLSKRRPA